MKMQKVKSNNTNFDMFYNSGSQLRLHSVNAGVVTAQLTHQTLHGYKATTPGICITSTHPRYSMKTGACTTALNSQCLHNRGHHFLLCTIIAVEK